MKIRAMQTDKDIKNVTKLLIETFPDRNTKIRFQTLIMSPYFRHEYTRLAEIDNEIVSFVMFVPQKIRIGLSVLEGGWIYFGCTKVEYRKKGFYTNILMDLLGYLQKKNIIFIILYGKTRFYSKFGFTPCFYRSMALIYNRSVKKIKEPHYVRRCEEKDINNVRELYDFYVRKRTSVNLIRPIEFWGSTLRYHQYKEGLLIVEDNSDHELLGYFWVKPPHNDMLWVEEVETKDKEAYQTILSYCAKEAKRLSLRKICFPISLKHPFGQFCLSLGADGSMGTAKPEGNRFGMEDLVNLLNPLSALRAMRPEFDRLILNSDHKNWTGKISLKVGQERINLCIEGGKIEFNQDCQTQNNNVKVPRKILAQLIVGFKNIHEIRHYTSVSIESQFLGILSTIFPKRYPQAPTWEWEFPESENSEMLSTAKEYFFSTSLKLLKFSRKFLRS